MNDPTLPSIVELPPEKPPHPLLQFGNWKVNTFVPPILLALVWVLNNSPLVSLMTGFHIWMHEFGHATAAWMTGKRATPLPFGWTPVESDYSPFVYWGLLLMFGILFVTGWKERKPWPMVVAVALAGAQYWMTWRLTDYQQEFLWGPFCGVGGEFYLSTLFMLFFYMQLPEKFQWGLCRYVFFIIGASAFLHIIVYWNQVYHGTADIPMGSMINGEDDSNGDMNRLMDDYGWKKIEIRTVYQHLGYGCWFALILVWGLFAARLDKVADWIAEKILPGE